MGNGDYSQFITRCLCHSWSLRGRILTLFPCSRVKVPLTGDSSPQTSPSVSPSHRLQLFTNCPSVDAFPRGAVLQEQAAPAWVPHGVTSPASKPAPAWAPLSTGPQVLAGACSSAGSPWGHSFLQASTCSGVGSLSWATGGYVLHCGPPWTVGEQPASPWSSSQVAREGSLL